MKKASPLKSISILLLTAMLAALGLSTLPARSVHAATITVNTIDDELNTDGDCSLREAIRAANLNTVVDACPAGSGADTIMLPAGTFVLTLPGTGENLAATGDLDITDQLTLQGVSKASTIIYANGIDRVLDIYATVQIANLTVANGDSGSESGGGIRVGGDLTLSNSRVTDNTTNAAGGGIYVSSSSANLTVIDSRIYNNHAAFDGGGIYNFGSITLVNSLVDGNTSSSGGGISSQKTLVLIDSTVSGNDGGPYGGGVKVVGTTDLYNVTITANLASQGGGVLVATAATLNAKNSLIAGNTNRSLTTSPDCSGELISQGYNLVGDTTDCTIIGSTGNITGVNPNLGPLQNNGGPTLTHALLVNSPAIDAGNPSGCDDPHGIILTTDQRGYARPIDGDSDGSQRCDIGAFERLSPGAPTPTRTPTPTKTSTPTNTPTPTASATQSQTPTATRSNTATPPTASASTATPTPSATSTNTPTLIVAEWTSTPSFTPAESATPGPSPTASNTPEISYTPTSTAGPSPTPFPDGFPPTPEITPPADARLFLPIIQ
jgi:CSLREA domain-containing protein